MPLGFVPVVALPLVALLIALINAGGILLVYQYTDAFFDAIERYVPFIGKRLAGKARDVTQPVIARIRRWNREYWESMPGWLNGLREAQASLDAATLTLAVATRARFDRLTRPRGPGVEPGPIPRALELLGIHGRRLDNIEAAEPLLTRTQLIQLRNDLYAPGTGDLKVIDARLSTHHSRLLLIETVELPVHEGRLDTHHRRLVTIEEIRLPEHETRLNTHHARIRAIEETEIPAGRARDAAQDDRLAGLEPIAGAIATAIPLALLAPTMKTLLQNEPKLRRFCSMDLDKFDDFLGFAGPIPSLAAIRETVRGASRLVDELAGLLRVPLGR